MAPRLTGELKMKVLIAGGHGKARAIRAVLQSGVLTGLITDEATARRIVDRDAEAGPADAGPAAPATLSAS